jgi:hypothetical protein
MGAQILSALPSDSLTHRSGFPNVLAPSISRTHVVKDMPQALETPVHEAAVGWASILLYTDLKKYSTS